MKKLTGSIVALGSLRSMRTAALILPAFGSCVTGTSPIGTDAIIALGTTGETASTSLEEDIKTLECVIDTSTATSRHRGRRLELQ